MYTFITYRYDVMKKIYILTTNGKMADIAFTTLRPLCDHHKIPYRPVMEGKRVMELPGNITLKINEIPLQKVKGRDNNFNKKKTNEF